MKISKNDILVNKSGDRHKVLEVLGCLYFLSWRNTFDVASMEPATEKELTDGGFTLESKGKWKPEKGERYCFVGDFGLINLTVWLNDFSDAYRLSTDNVHRSESDAELYKQKLLKLGSEN